MLVRLLMALMAAVLFLPVPDADARQSDGTVTCHVQWVHDGDTLRCAGYKKSTRLYGIDAPEMRGACRLGRECTPGDPYASKAYLERLIRGRTLQCDHIETDHYGRPVMRCWAGKTDLSCEMVKSGYAVKRYGGLFC